MAIPAGERNAVIKVFNSEEFDDWNEAEAADAIIEALNQVRENSKRFVVVANLQWPGSDKFDLVSAGPFNTANQANAVGVTFAADPVTQKGRGRWRTVPILSPAAKPARTLWGAIRESHEPDKCCSLHHGWLKDEAERWIWVKYDPDKAHSWKVGW